MWDRISVWTGPESAQNGSVASRISDGTFPEIVAASACAVELIHTRGLLSEMGLPQETTPLFVENSGASAVELSFDRK